MYFVCHVYHILYSYNKVRERKILRKSQGKYIHRTIHTFIEKNSTNKWACIVQTAVVQESTVYVKI